MSTTPSPAPEWAKPYTEIQELAQAIRLNLQHDIAEPLRDDVWVITAAAHALVILDNVELATKHAAALSEENERLKRDAERYRALRGRLSHTLDDVTDLAGYFHSTEGVDEAVDRELIPKYRATHPAIDSAMKQEGRE